MTRGRLLLAGVALLAGCSQKLDEAKVKELLTSIDSYSGFSCDFANVTRQGNGTTEIAFFGKEDGSSCIEALQATGAIESTGEPIHVADAMHRYPVAIVPPATVIGTEAFKTHLQMKCGRSKLISIDTFEVSQDGKSARVRYSYTQELHPEARSVAENCPSPNKLVSGTNWRDVALGRDGWELGHEVSVVTKTEAPLRGR